VKRIGKIDTAELEPVGVGRHLRWRMVDACDLAPRASAVSVTTLPSAPSAPVTTTTFPFISDLRVKTASLSPFEITCNGGAFCGEIIGTT